MSAAIESRQVLILVVASATIGRTWELEEEYNAAGESYNVLMRWSFYSIIFIGLIFLFEKIRRRGLEFGGLG